MSIRKLTALAALFCSITAAADTYDFNTPLPLYSDGKGYGYDITKAPDLKTIDKATAVKPYYFSVQVPDGNYKVTVTLGSKKRATETIVRAENRRMMTGKITTRKGEMKTVSFLVNKRDVNYTATDRNGKATEAKVRIKPGEVGSLTWDEKLTLEFNGAAPRIQKVTIEPDTTAVTAFLCGNSTVVDQGKEPWASWGQMIPNMLPGVCIANYGESGLTATSFMAQNRLDKILSIIKPGDYVFCEFGHNDEKEKGPGTGAWYHYTVALKKFVDMVRAKQGHIIFCTPTRRRFFENGKLRNTHGDFPDAMRAVAKREKVDLIDINEMSRVLFETMGSEGSKHLLVHYPMGSFPWQDRKFEDNTHFNPFGAYEIAKCIVQGLHTINSPLLKYLTPDWNTFNPSQPDNWETFYWPQSILHDSTKPDGN